MLRHRLAEGAEYYRLPAPPLPNIAPAGFMVLPVQACCPQQQLIYLWAFQQALAIARPAITERHSLFAVN